MNRSALLRILVYFLAITSCLSLFIVGTQKFIWPIGCGVLLFYIFIHTWLFQKSWPFNIIASKVFRYIISISTVINLLVSFSAAAILLSTLSDLWFGFIVGGTTIIGLILASFQKPHALQTEELSYEKSTISSITAKRITVGLLFASFISIIILSTVRTGKYITSPWGVIPSIYIVLVFILCAGTIYLVQTYHKKNILFLVVAFSLTIHLYLPLVYRVGFGGDRWRHMAYAGQILTKKPIEPTILPTDNYPRVFKNIGPIQIPEGILDPKASYSFTWGWLAFFTKTTGLDVATVDIWLFPIIWALFVPLIMIELGKTLFLSQRSGLLMGVLITIFATFQVNGSITTPISMGLFFLILYMTFLFELLKQRKKIVTILPFVLLFIFQYAVTVISLLATLGLVVVSGVANRWLRRFLQVSVIFGTIGLVIFADTRNNYSTIKVAELVDWRYITTTFWIWLQGLIGISGGRIVNGFQTAGQLAQWFFVIMGGVTIHRALDSRLRRLAPVFIITTIIFIILGYLDSNIVHGLRLFVGRFPMYLTFSSIFLITGALKAYSKIRKNSPAANYLVCLLLTLLFIQQFTTAPRLGTVTEDEVKVAELVSQEVAKDKFVCVIGQEWQLLALQKSTMNRVQGGGFPIERDFIQADKDAIYSNLIRFGKQEYLDQAKKLTNTNKCFFLFEQRVTKDPQALSRLRDLLGTPQRVGEIYIFRPFLQQAYTN